MANGNGWTLKLVSIIATIIIGVILFMGNVVRGNDLTNREEHKDINVSLGDFRVEQMRQGTILERIDNKL